MFIHITSLNNGSQQFQQQHVLTTFCIFVSLCWDTNIPLVLVLLCCICLHRSEHVTFTIYGTSIVLTHSVCNALNELCYQLLSRGYKGLLLAKLLQVDIKRALQLPLTLPQYTLLGLQSFVALHEFIQ